MSPTAASEVLDETLVHPNQSKPKGSKIIDDELRTIDIDVARLIVNGKTLDNHPDIANSLTDGDIERTIDGASVLNLTLHDKDRSLQDNSDIFEEDAEVEIDGVAYVRVATKKQGDEFPLTFEDREIHWLRKYDRPRKAYRDKMTRAEFVLALVREVKEGHIDFYCPELHKLQPIATAAQKPTKKTKNAKRHPGFAKGAHITVKHVKAKPGQISILERTLDVGFSMHAPYKVQLAAIAVVVQESDATMLNGQGGYGQFSQLRNGAWPASTTDVERNAHAFYKIAIANYRRNPSMKVADLGQSVQNSGAGASYYDKWVGEAVETFKQYAGGAKGGGSVSVTKFTRFAFQRGQNGKRENSWECIQRLASDVNWRAFMSAGTLYFISETALFASRPRMVISEESEGVDWIDYELDKGKMADTVTVACRADRWEAPPGSVVQIKDTGPANGRWLVADVKRGLYTSDMTITLRSPTRAKPEPAPSTVTTTVKGSGGKGTSNSKLDKMYAKAKAIDKRHYPYRWGGGHGSFSGPYDCSGAVSAVLHAAGLLSSPEATGALAGWGQSGPGKLFTVWVRNGGQGGGHTYLEFHQPKHVFWGTSTSNPGGGAGFHPPRNGPAEGFHPRHYKGM